MATEGAHACVADDFKGLKVSNIASPQSVKQVRALDNHGLIYEWLEVFGFAAPGP